MIIEPKKITKTAKITLVAPSFGCTTEPYLTRLNEAIKIFKELGFQVVEGENIFKEDGIASSNTPEERAKEFMKAYDSDTDVIMSVGGGELMCEILPYIDFKKIKRQKPKWFVGFSDNTNLTFTLTTICNLVTIYGPCATKFYLYPFKFDAKDTLGLLEGKRILRGYPRYELTSLATPEKPLAKLNLTERKIIKPFNYKESIYGTMLGGCLDCLINLCGTKYDNVANFISKHTGIIWYLEACDLSPLGIRRALFQLKEAGWFKKVKGFLIGRPLCGDAETFGVDKYTAVIDVLQEFNVPILMDVDLGHLAPSMPIKNGAKAVVSYVDGNIKMEYLKKYRPR